MQTYDVQQRELYLIKSQTGISYNIALLPGESIEGYGGVEVRRTGYRLLITSESPLATMWGYRIDYDDDGNVMYPVTPEDIEQLIGDLTKIGCCEYTPDLLRAIVRSKDLMADYKEKTEGKIEKIIKKLRL